MELVNVVLTSEELSSVTTAPKEFQSLLITVGPTTTGQTLW